MQAEEVLSAYVDDYLDALRALSYRDLEKRQDGFHASLAFGAAGVAYAFWYAGLVFGEEGLQDEAERWAGSAAGRERERLSFLVPMAELEERPPSHYLYGEAGLAFVRVLVAHARRDERARDRALQRFLELVRLSAAGSPELYNGASGCLAAAAILFRYTRDARLRNLGEDLAAHLTGRAARTETGTVVWPELEGFGLAHGSSGVYLALLQWSAASGSPLPEWFAPSLEGILSSALRDPLSLCPGEMYHSMLCNGFTGLAFLGAKAHQLSGEPGLLGAAAGAMRLVLEGITDQADLCCGRTGIAFACLALARVDPEGPWRKHARDLALSTLLCEREDWESAGLYGGEAAVLCLALNLTHGIDAGPPGLDLIEYPVPGLSTNHTYEEMSHTNQGDPDEKE